MDVGAGCGQYMFDMTDDSVDGRFTAAAAEHLRRRAAVFRRVAAEMVPGVLLRDLRTLTEKLVEQELLSLGSRSGTTSRSWGPEKPLFKKYFMHGVAHSLGLDVHDVGAASRPVHRGGS